jgi:hypothetical protein
LFIKVVHQPCVDAIGVLFKIVNIDGLPITARTVAGATSGFQQLDGCRADQADGNGTFEECPAGHTASADFRDDFVDDFTLFKDHMRFSFGQSANEYGSKAL